LLELTQFLHDALEEHHPLYGLQASPVPPQPADLFLLGTTPASAELAASLGIPYVFALFLNSDEAVMGEAIDTYHKRFDTTKRPQPQVMLALPVIVADTEAEARHYAADIKVVRIRLASGRTFTVGTVEAAKEFGRQSQEPYTIDVHDASTIYGCRDTVRKKLDDMRRLYHADELIVVTAIKNFQKRLHSYELLSDAFAPAAVL
jgi:luciferase family oxidoreductase group 1